MNTERILSAGMAVVVIAAVGLSASTLAASMSTDPSDAVDVQWDALPLGEDSQGDIESAAESVDETYRQSGASGDADGGPGSGGEAEQQNPKAGDGPAEKRQAGDAAGDRESQNGNAGEGVAQANGADGNSQAQSSSASRWVPGGLPLWLVALVALLLAVVILAYRYRDRLRRAVGRDGDGAAAEPLAPAPQNEVERAWVELVQRAGIDRPRTRTPRDCARRAVETGFDPGHVDRLRRTFEDVRYGTHPPTDEQARLARETLDRLNGERA
ncbi:DUF4129 domain-containing protein [Haloarcula onubensis]|uniref:DUF4129 domain-containing protein n=1 Tax=Haloarcula onubensis TaxID=2950539 RepID=A0ABU2FNG1_9EURY|nr:DUF4129 domain-containing protein [Halomicroarcula sp. S3CR25-11]MDS0282295.1 DUF4129 domain-containing protein [Halomicroarcula sp. S3CR25-11]